ncbi:unnamed protein product [Ilex paraguariensis]|uniref:Uncharacterized protein n=1 Tax=Ilex paraguariensis TaxID=185542 RepID=A0ABC8T098_9AQUA
MTSVPGASVGMKCHEALLYVAAGSSVSIIDLRTMRKVCTIASRQSNLYSFEFLPSKSLICTGGIGRASLWDIRSCDSPKAEPITELDGHMGPVTRLHMDPYKIVTGGPDDTYVNIWEAETGTQTNSLICCSPDSFYSSNGCSAMSVDGCRISCDEEQSVLRYRDFNNATCVAASDESRPASKFWGLQSYSDADESDG